MERSTGLSLKHLFCLPLKSEIIEETQAPVHVLVSQDSKIEEEDVVEPIQQVS